MSLCRTGKCLCSADTPGVTDWQTGRSQNLTFAPRDTFAPLEQLRTKKHLRSRDAPIRLSYQSLFTLENKTGTFPGGLIYEPTHKIRSCDLLCCDLSAAEFERCYRSSASGGRRAKIQSAERNDSSRRHGTMELGRERPQLNLWNPWESGRIMGFRRSE
jgi:hypothetical protein